MTTIVLNAETSGLTIEHLIQQASQGEVQIKDTSGNVVAYVLTAAHQQSLAQLEEIFARHSGPDQLREALRRQGGITTAGLLERAETAARQADQP